MITNSLIRQRIEVAVIRLLLTKAQESGFTLYAIDDGENVVRVKTADRAMEKIFNLDDCYIKFSTPDDKQFLWARIILGEDGYDCISDYSIDDGPFDRMMKEISAVISESAITFVPCTGAHPAYKVGRNIRGICINCGNYHT